MRHVYLTCKNHNHLRWSCKSIAFSQGYGYNGARNIFYLGTLEPNKPTCGNCHVQEAECSCPPSDLILAPDNPRDETSNAANYLED